MTFRNRGFGRRHAPDPRDQQYPMRIMLRPTSFPISKYYTASRKLPMDQGDTGTCVAHAWTGFLIAALTMCKNPPNVFDTYRHLVALDEFTENDSEATEPDNTKLQSGTSVRAGAKYLQDLKHLKSYVWAHTVDEMAAWILGGQGTIVLGTNWYMSMSDLDAKHFARITPGSDPIGGHAYLCLGFNRRTQTFRCMNSWGLNFGDEGRFNITYDDMKRLLHEEGEACAAVEVVVPPVTV